MPWLVLALAARASGPHGVRKRRHRRNRRRWECRVARSAWSVRGEGGRGAEVSRHCAEDDRLLARVESVLVRLFACECEWMERLSGRPRGYLCARRRQLIARSCQDSAAHARILARCQKQATRTPYSCPSQETCALGALACCRSPRSRRTRRRCRCVTCVIAWRSLGIIQLAHTSLNSRTLENDNTV